MTTIKGFVSVLTTFSAIFTPTGSGADEVGQRAREVLQIWKASVVTVRLVVKERWIFEGMENDSSEYAAEVTGFVVAADGTVATSLAATDPEVFYAQWFGDDDGFKIRTEMTSLTIIGDDGAELPSDVVLRDRDLDLIFIRPKAAPAEPPMAVPLGSGTAAAMFDEVVQLERYDHTMKRTCGGRLCRIGGIMDKPRRLYAIDASEGSLGSPIFTLDGRLLGMTALRQLSKAASSERGMWSNVDDITIVVVSADDVAEAVKQLPPRD